MEIQEFETKVYKLKGRKNRGFKMDIDFYLDSSAEYVCKIKLIDWKLDDLYAYGQRNFDFESGVFIYNSHFSDSVIILHEKSLNKLLDIAYKEILYVVRVFDFVEKKSFYRKYEVSF